MRLLHTADWHLGRALYGARLLDDQVHVLEGLVEVVRDAKPDAVVIAGDVFDRAQPPRDAIALLNDVISRIVLGEEVPVVMIAGNHDNPELIEFAARITAKGRLYLSGVTSSDIDPVMLGDDHAVLRLYPIPYAEPVVVRQALDLAPEDAPDHAAAMAAVLKGIRTRHPSEERAVIVAHAFVAGGEESTSERPLSVGGAGSVPADLFSGFVRCSSTRRARSTTRNP
jgi:exonuclease SbcD